jgi:hypothetical protein
MTFQIAEGDGAAKLGCAVGPRVSAIEQFQGLRIAAEGELQLPKDSAIVRLSGRTA